MLNKSNPLGYMSNGNKILKKYFLLQFDPILKVWVLSNGVKDTP